MLLDKGVLESRIVFLSLIAAPEGIHRICKKFPRMKVVTSEIDEGLNGNFQVVPGAIRMMNLPSHRMAADEFTHNLLSVCFQAVVSLVIATGADKAQRLLSAFKQCSQ